MFAIAVAIVIIEEKYDLRSNEPSVEVTTDRTFNRSKTILERDIYNTDKLRQTFYCGCKYTKSKVINHASCGYKAKGAASRAKRLEWEHVVPASFFGKTLPCWQNGGRENCKKVSGVFNLFESDIDNLVPAVGEINGNRRDYLFGEVPGEARNYGKCDFEIANKIAEPSPQTRGEIARVWLLMRDRYKLDLSPAYERQLKRWDKADPIDDTEREIKKRKDKANETY